MADKQWGIAAVVNGGFPMRKSFASASARLTTAERLEVVAQHLEGPAWVGLFGLACFAGFLMISM